MQDGEIIEDRILDKIIREYASSRPINHESFSGDWVHHLSSNHDDIWLSGYKTSLNTSAAAAIAQDKVATYELLTARDIPAVPHYLYRHVLSDEAVEALTHKNIITKPLTGTGGRGIRLHDTLDDAIRFMDKNPDSWAVSPYVDIQSETRAIILDGEIILSFEKSGTTRPSDTLTLYNLSHGGTPRVRSLDQSEITLAIQGQKSLGLSLCAVDIVLTPYGQAILEINDGFMLEHFMRLSEEYANIGRKAYETIFDSRLLSK